STLAPTSAAALESVTRPVSVAVERVKAKLVKQRQARMRRAKRDLRIHEDIVLPCCFILRLSPVRALQTFEIEMSASGGRLARRHTATNVCQRGGHPTKSFILCLLMRVKTDEAFQKQSAGKKGSFVRRGRGGSAKIAERNYR